MDRRTFLSGTAAAAGSPVVTAGLSAFGPAAAATGQQAFDLLKQAPLMNLPRAWDVLARQGLDGLIVTRDHHVYHLCNFFPSGGRMGMPNTCFGLLSADPNRKPGLVIPQFLHFYVYSNWGIEAPYDIYPYGNIDDIDVYMDADDRFVSEPQAVPAGMFRVADESLVTDRQRDRASIRDAAAAAHGVAAGPEWGLLKAVRDFGLTRGRIAVDDPWISQTLEAAGVNATFVPAENVLRRIRLGRSPTEVAMMRRVAVQNADAALAAARRVHAGMTFRDLRAAFYAEAAARGHVGVFMVIDSVSAEPFNATFEEGTGFSIDCVSHMMHYHGDFARTIFIGEPPALLRRATEASALGWDAVREKLKPGLRYEDIRQIGRDALRKGGYGDFHVTFTPHSVGLFHTDEPVREGVPFLMKDNLELVENMVLSVDCPVLMDGIGGTVHLEDLVLITKDGAELLNPSTDRVIMV